jgi:hypothetical protein
MRAPILIVAILCSTAAQADLASARPEELCTLLVSYGMTTTEFASPAKDERPLCYTPSQPALTTQMGYEFSYRVLSHWEWNIANSLFLSLQGDPAVVLGKPPHAKFVEMARQVLGAILEEPERQQLLQALQSLAPGDNRLALVRGLNIQLRYLDHSIPGWAYIEFRLDVSNVCNFSPADTYDRVQCVESYRELR